MEKRKLEDLKLLDDFLFGTMVSYPGIGEDFVREMLKVIFGREFGSLTVVAQKVERELFFSIQEAQKEIRRKNCVSFSAIWSIQQKKMP